MAASRTAAGGTVTGAHPGTAARRDGRSIGSVAPALPIDPPKPGWNKLSRPQALPLELASTPAATALANSTEPTESGTCRTVPGGGEAPGPALCALPPFPH
ncbi:hypothetical protein GCM10020001_017870 [Nonomuraea salmonea]